MELRLEKGVSSLDTSMEFDAVIDAETETPAIREALKVMPSQDARRLMAACGFFANLGNGSSMPLPVGELKEVCREELRSLYNPSLRRTGFGLN